MTSKAGKKRLEAIHKLPCLACVQDGQMQPNRTTAHHVVSQSYRRLSGGHESTVPLCAHHHMGEPKIGFNKTQMQNLFGPSLADNKRAFVKKYGTELALLERVNAIIG